MSNRIAYVTNVEEYVGPPTAQATTEAGWQVFCHDDSFADEAARTRYEQDHPGCIAAAARDPGAFIAEGLARFGRIDALISNDIPKGTSMSHANAGRLDWLDEFETYCESLLFEPVHLLRAAVPAFREAGCGSIVLVSSGAPLRNPPMPAPYGYLAARAGVNALTKALANDLAGSQVQVNAVAPLLVYSQTFFPSAIGAEDPAYVPIVEAMVPMGRFGRPEEVGKLIALLAGGEAGFVSGQVIAFSGAGC